MSTLLKSSIFIFLLFLSGCDEDKTLNPKSCPNFQNIPSPTYDHPLWHPNKNIIGFNHRPIRKIIYEYGYDCPAQATYIYKEDSIGFYLITADGTNKRMALHRRLETPAWSADGKWIAYSTDAQIYKMPFDGEKFDTTAIEQLTAEGRNFFPAWSPDGAMISYDNTSCGNASGSILPNNCGILLMDVNGDNKRLIATGRRMPYWDKSNAYIYSFGVKFELTSGISQTFFNPETHNLSLYNPPKFNPENTRIGFVAYPIEGGAGNFYTITADGKDLKKISTTNVYSFSWSPSGDIVYSNYDFIRIDRVSSTLWIMDAGGLNLKQLTFNHL